MLTKIQLCLMALLTVVIFSAPAFAFYTTLDNGEILEPGHYRLGVNTQFITEGDDGVNVGLRFDAPIDEELNWRALLGFGTTDVFVGGYLKWVPFPDTDTQPAVGVISGILFARYSGDNELTLRVNPFVSKKYSLTFGDFNSYLALPFSIKSYGDKTDIPVQATLGTEYRTESLENVGFWAEIGFDLNDAFPYFAIGATLQVDESEGIQFR